jgi:perosamine synthetase
MLNVLLNKLTLGQEEVAAVNKVILSGQLSTGPVVAKFEQTFSRFCQAKYAVALVNGTAALHLALLVAGIKEKDEVITTPFSFVATANSILMAGGKPVFADIREDTFNIDIEQAKEKLTGKTKAVLPVDLYGQPYDYSILKPWAIKHKLIIIEDACQAVGADYKLQKAGTLGDIGVFSFYATKNITTGEGGMLITNKAAYQKQARLLRQHNQPPDSHYYFSKLGYNYRMTDIQAAIGLEQLRKLPKLNNKRLQNAKLLNMLLNGIQGIITPKIAIGYQPVFHQYVIRVTKDYPLTRQQLQTKLAQKGIETRVVYPIPLHLLPHFKELGYKKGQFPVAETAAKEVLSLPVHPALTRVQLELIAQTIRKAGR